MLVIFNLHFFPSSCNAFYLQFQHLILSEELLCTPEASVLLASYAVQAKVSVTVSQYFEMNIIRISGWLPQSVLEVWDSVAGCSN